MKAAEKLREALKAGEIRAIGGVVFDHAMKPLFCTTTLHAAIQELGRRGLSVQRQDAGGSPRWALEE